VNLLDPIISRWRKAMVETLDQDPYQYDPNYTGRLLEYMERWADYFGAEVRDVDRIPDSGPVMLVGNHSGGMVTPDTAALYVHWYRRFGIDRPLLGMGFDAAFSIPVLGPIMRKIGQLPASREMAREALSRDAGLLVYPGGSQEVFRPYSDRNSIQMQGRKGFLRIAQETGVPVVPVVGHGGHETTIVLARGSDWAESLGLKDRLRLDVFPILLQFPWGVSTPALPGVPLPAKITMQVLEPTTIAPDADLEAAYEAITGRMQLALDALAEENPQPLRTGFQRHLEKIWP